MPQTYRRISLGFFQKPLENGESAICRSLLALRELGKQVKHWSIPFSGGKDSTAVTALVLWAIENGYVERPKTLTVLRSDTTQELPELNHNAEILMAEVRRRGFRAVTVGPVLKDRFYVNILGRGLLPVHASLRGRWCTRVLKVKPMEEALAKTAEAVAGEKFLMMSGVRFNESRSRDAKLNDSKQVAFAACSKDSGECGSGGIWMDKKMSGKYVALPLIVNWRECIVYDFLQGWFVFNEKNFYRVDLVPSARETVLQNRLVTRGSFLRKGHGLERFTQPVAKMYGQHEDGLVERSLRFGCLGCSVVSEDRMTIEAAKKNPKLTPILELRAVWEEMRNPAFRLWKPSKNQNFSKGHHGPLTIKARKYFLPKILDIQRRSEVVLVTDADLVEIERCWREGVYPRGWTGDEILACDAPQTCGFFVNRV